MTRISGEMILKTPCCESMVRAPRYASINLMAWEYWTDGYSEGSLAPQHQGLMMCVCGQAYLLRKATKVLDLPKIPRHVRDSSKKPTWLRRIKTWFSPDENASLSVREEASKASTWISAAHENFRNVQSCTPVMPDQLPNVITSACHDRELQVVARRQYWWYRNMSHRDYFRAYREAHRNDWPVFEPDNDQKENMASLIGLLEYQGVANALEIAELHRELGEFVAARTALEIHGNADDARARAIAHCNELRLTTPARFRYQ